MAGRVARNDPAGPPEGAGGDGLLPFLNCLQVTDSLFPTGMYTLSHGLETFAADTEPDAAAVESLLEDHLRHGVGQSDAVAAAITHRAVLEDDLDAAVRADLRLTAVKLSREQRDASIRVGRRLLTLSDELFDLPAVRDHLARVAEGGAPGNHAVALALVLAGSGADVLQSVTADLYAFAAGFVAAAVRLSIIDHRRAQAVLHGLAPVIAETARTARFKRIADIGGCTPGVDVMAMRHEGADVRLFMT